MISFEEFFEQSDIFESVTLRDESIIVRLKPSAVEELSEGAYFGDIVKLADKFSKKNSSPVNHKMVKLKSDGLVIYNTNANTGKRKDDKQGVKKHIQYIKMLDWKEVMSGNNDAKPIEKVRMAMLGDIEVRCTCPAFKYYGYEYLADNLGFLYGKAKNAPSKAQGTPAGEITPPIKRNKGNRGTVCKHLYSILNRWTAQVGPITSAYNNDGKPKQGKPKKNNRKPDEKQRKEAPPEEPTDNVEVPDDEGQNTEN
jgi:hypothetical protein